MNKENNSYEDFAPMMSIEEFDMIDKDLKKHSFSDEYIRRKEKIMNEYKHKKTGNRTQSIVKFAAAAAALFVAAPIAVNAATDGEFFQRIWGNADKATIESYEVTFEEDGKIDENGNVNKITYTMPKVEYTEIDETRAAELLGDYVSDAQTQIKMGDTTMTVLSVVRDENSIVAEYTLEKEGGVDCFNYSDFDNHTKGAWLNEDQKINFGFEEGAGKIYVDLERSTPDKLYCYEYMAAGSFLFDQEDVTDHITLWYSEFTKPMSEMYKEMEESDNYDYAPYIVKEDRISVPVKDAVESVTYTNAEGGSVKISPISMTLTSCKGLLSELVDGSECVDFVKSVEITYKDGSTYLVMDENVASYEYLCGNGDAFVTLFNRVVDVDQVQSITVNDVVYSLN